MYRGKYSTSRSRGKKPALLLVSLALLLTVSVAGTVAYIATGTGPITNTFAPTGVPVTVQETIEDNMKKDVKVLNDDVPDAVTNVPAYIRVAVVATWRVTNSNLHTVLGSQPVEGTDYTMDWTMKGWVKGSDGYYYYTQPVQPGQTTDVLFTNCKLIGDTPGETYALSVEVLAQSIQANGKTDDNVPAVTEAWGVAVNDDSTLKVEQGGERS